MAAAVIAALASAATEYARARTQQQQNAPKVAKLRDPNTGVAVRVTPVGFSGVPGADPLLGYGQGPTARFASDIIRIPGSGGTQQTDTGTFDMNLGGPYGLTTNRTASSTRTTGGRAATRMQGGLPVFTGQAVRRRRRMNVTNVKALRRAERRVGGFVKLARKFVTFHTSHKLKHHRRRR